MAANTVTSGAKLDMEIVQGATFLVNLEWQTATGTPIDLAGYTARMQIRADHTASTVLIELTTVNNRISLNTPTTGGIQLKITAADAEAITWSSGVYDLELIHTVGAEQVVDNILYGNVTVRKNVTR
jgi:hypothetical protein